MSPDESAERHAKFPVSMHPDLFRKMEAARRDVPRSRFIARAVEQALLGAAHVPAHRAPTAAAPEPGSMIDLDVEPVAPSGRRRMHQPGPNVENLRSSSQAKRNVKPIPKGKQ